MLFYISLLFGTTIIAWLAKETGNRAPVGLIDVDSRFATKKSNFFFTAIVLIVLVGIAGLRNSWNDTGAYIMSFEDTTSDFSYYLHNQLKLFNGDWAFTFILVFIKSFISEEPWVFLMFYSSATIILTVVTLEKYSRDFNLAVFLYISTQLYWTQMGAIRQSFAAALIFAAFPLIEERKWVKYFLIVLVAAQFHNSAYIFLILYFICRIPAFSKYSLMIIFGAVVLFITYPITGQFINDLLADSKYGAAYSSSILAGNDGSSALRIVVEAVPLIIGYVFRKDIMKYERYGNIVFNMTLFQVIISIFSVKYWIFFRLTVYTQCFSILMLCWSLKYFDRNSNLRHIVKMSCYILYTIYYYIFMKLSSSTYVSDILHIVAKH